MGSTADAVRFAFPQNSGAEKTGKIRSSTTSDQARGIGRRFGVLHKPARTASLLFACVLIGYWLNAFDDAVSGVGKLPSAMWVLVYSGGWGGAIAGLTLIASTLFHVRKRWIPVGALFATLAFFLAMMLFSLSPLSSTVGYIYGNETALQLAGKASGMRLFLCWGATLIAAGATWSLRSRRIDWRWVLGCLGVGLGAAVLNGVSLLGRYAPWITHMKWSKFLSTGIMALLFVLLTGILAEAVQNRRDRRNEPAA